MLAIDDEKKETKGLPTRYYEQLRSLVGILGQVTPIAELANRFYVTEGFARYHTNKVAMPGWHGGTWGGSRHRLFNDDDEQVAQLVLWVELKVNPLRSMKQLMIAVNDDWHVPITITWVRRVLKKWRWTNKKAAYRVIQKYSTAYRILLVKPMSPSHCNHMHVPWYVPSQCYMGLPMIIVCFYRASI